MMHKQMDLSSIQPDQNVEMIFSASPISNIVTRIRESRQNLTSMQGRLEIEL